MGKDKVDDRGQDRWQKAGPHQEVDTKDDEVAMYRDRMVECFDAAIVVMEKAELVTDGEYESGLVAYTDLKTRIALSIFDRSTRQMPAQDKIFGLALQYVNLLMKEKEADMKRSEELGASMRAWPGSGQFVAAVPPCPHAGLRALREALMCEDHLSPEGHKAIDALSVKRPPQSDVDVLLCPDCLAHIPADKLKSGEPWDEPAEERAGKPEGPSVSDTPVFRKALEEVHESGKTTLSVMKRETVSGAPRKMGDMDILDVFADSDFFETVRSKHGDGVYIFKLWKRNLELHSDHEFLIQAPDRVPD